MKTTLLTCAAMSAALSVSASGERPNVIVILADDMGYSDIGCFGSEINTPNIDRIASEGITMTSFYNAGRSCPSRAALLTGMYHHKTGVGAMAKAVGNLPGYQGYLSDSCRTIAEVLRDSGYTTYMSGKWHLGVGEGQWPSDRGFERSYVFLGGATNYFYPNDKNNRKQNMAEDGNYITVPDNDYYITDAFSDNAVRYINESDKDKPFFMYLAYTTPHWPLQVHPEDIAKYKGRYDEGWDKLREERYKRMINLDIIDKRWALSPRDETVPAWNSLSDAEQQQWASLMEIYAAMIERMDYGIGQVLAALEDKGELDNTLIMFMADNGGCMEIASKFADLSKYTGDAGSGDSFLAYEAPWANVSDTPFRYFKHWMHEGGISTPFVARWPEMIKAGTKSNCIAHLIDIMPTCIELSGTKDYTGGDTRIKHIDGSSLVPIFKGRDKPIHDVLLFEHLGFRALRLGEWKIVSTWPENHWALYNMSEDRTELNDLSAIMQDKVATMNSLYMSEAAKAQVVDWKIASKMQKQRPKSK